MSWCLINVEFWLLIDYSTGLWSCFSRSIMRWRIVSDYLRSVSCKTNKSDPAATLTRSSWEIRNAFELRWDDTWSSNCFPCLQSEQYTIQILRSKYFIVCESVQTVRDHCSDVIAFIEKHVSADNAQLFSFGHQPVFACDGGTDEISIIINTHCANVTM